MTASTFDASPFGRIAAGIVGNSLDRKTKALLGRGDSPRSGEPVWRNSYYRGQIEDRVWRPIGDGTKRGGTRWTRALLKRAKELEYASRLKRRESQPGSENGAIGTVGLEVLEYLYSIVDFAKGTLEPAIATIATEVGRSYAAVHRALIRLRHCGFLRWMRRSEPIENPVPGGPQVKQITNAYALMVPEGMKSWLARMLRPSPTPACEEDKRARDKRELERMVEGMTMADWQRDLGGAYHGDVLANFAATGDRVGWYDRESPKDRETGGSY